MPQRYDLSDSEKFTATINFHNKSDDELSDESDCNVAEPMHYMEGQTITLIRTSHHDRKGLKFYEAGGWMWSELWLDNIQSIEPEEDFV